MKFTIGIEDEFEESVKTVTSTFETEHWTDVIENLLGLLQTQGFIIPKNALYLNTSVVMEPEYLQFFSSKSIKDED